MSPCIKYEVTTWSQEEKCDSAKGYCTIAFAFSMVAAIPLMILGGTWIRDANNYIDLNADLEGLEHAKCQITWLRNYDCGSDGNGVGIEAEGVADICIPLFGNISIPWSGDVGPYDNCYKSGNAMLPYRDNGYYKNMIVDCLADCQGRVWYTNEPYGNPEGLLLRGILFLIWPFFACGIYCFLYNCVEVEYNWPGKYEEKPKKIGYLDANQNPRVDLNQGKYAKRPLRVKNSDDIVIPRGAKMEITGTQKYNGVVVLVTANVYNTRLSTEVWVKFVHSGKRIKIPIKCLKPLSGQVLDQDTEWQMDHVDLKEKIRGEWRNSDGLLISVDDDTVNFLPSGNSYKLCPFGENRLKMKIGDAWWCYSNKSSENVLFWSNHGEWVVWKRHVVEDLPPSYENFERQVEMSAPPSYEHVDLQAEVSVPPKYDAFGLSAPPAYNTV